MLTCKTVTTIEHSLRSMAVFLGALLSGEAKKRRAMRARTSAEAAKGFSMLPPQSPRAVSLPSSAFITLLTQPKPPCYAGYIKRIFFNRRNFGRTKKEKWVQFECKVLQSNLSNTDTEGTEPSVRIKRSLRSRHFYESTYSFKCSVAKTRLTLFKLHLNLLIRSTVYWPEKGFWYSRSWNSFARVRLLWISWC